MNLFHKIIDNFFHSKFLSKYIAHNKKYFKPIVSEDKILLEFNNWKPLHISFSYLANFLSTKFNSSIIAYPGYTLISENLERSFLKKLKFYLGKILRINNFGVFYSIGVTDILTIKISNLNKKKSSKLFNKLKKKIKSRKDILNIKIENIEIGDLIYDTYLAKKKSLQ